MEGNKRGLRPLFGLFFGLSIAILIALAGCAAEGQPDGEEVDASTENSVEADQAVESSEGALDGGSANGADDAMPSWLERELVEGRTLSQAKDAYGSLWIKRDDRYYSIELLYLNEATWFKNKEDGKNYGYWEVEGYRNLDDSFVRSGGDVDRNVDYAPVLKLSEGDVLVTTSGSNHIELDPVLGIEGYVYDDGRTTATGAGMVNDYREIDGVEVEDTDEARYAVLESKGIHYNEQLGDIVADDVTSVTGGFFSGTDWMTETITFDQQLLFAQVKPKIELSNIIETKEGYFIVDTSGLQAGEYILDGVHKYYFVVE